MSENNLPADLRIEQADSHRDIIAAFPLMQQLRPQLADADALLAYWQRAKKQAYQLCLLRRGDAVLAIASYRLQENLAHGAYLYIEDLVTDSRYRGHGYGEMLIMYLRNEARAQACRKIVLDTGLNNQLAHRFYFRQGLLASSLRFNQVLE